MRELVWDVANAPPPSALASLSLPSPLLARLLWNRGVRDAAAAQAFLAPAAQPLGQPARMAGVPAAVERIRDAIRRGERIGLHGDYDVDGVSATAVLTETL